MTHPRLPAVLLAAAVLVGAAALAAPRSPAKGVSLPVNLSGLSNAAALQAANGELARAPLGLSGQGLLALNGFVAVRSGWRDYAPAQADARADNLPPFITLDAYWRAFSLVAARVRRDQEDVRLLPTLQAFLASLAPALERDAAAADAGLRDGCERALGFVAVASRLSDSNAPLPARARAVVSAELNLIHAAAGTARSPLLGVNLDYTRVAPGLPPGSFRAATAWLAATRWRLTQESDLNATLCLTRAVAVTPRAASRWAAVRDARAAMSAPGIDLNLHDALKALTRAFGKGAALAALNVAPDRQNFLALAARAAPSGLSLPGAGLAFRFFDEPQAPDQFSLQALSAPFVGTSDAPRTVPRGLDWLAALGSSAAYRLLDASGDTSYANFDSRLLWSQAQLNAAQPSLDARVLSTLAAPPSTPAMAGPWNTPAWARRALQSRLAAWVSWRADLSVSAESGLAAPPPTPARAGARAWVEPDRALWLRLAELTRALRVAAGSAGSLSPPDLRAIASLEGEARFLARVADLQESGARLPDAANARLWNFDAWLREVTQNPGGRARGPEEPARVEAIITLAGMPDGAAQAATGRLQDLYVITPDGRGGRQLTRGAIGSYFELNAAPLGTGQWRDLLDSGAPPSAPDWTRAFTGR